MGHWNLFEFQFREIFNYSFFCFEIWFKLLYCKQTSLIFHRNYPLLQLCFVDIDDYFSSGFLEQPIPNFETTLERNELFECLTPDCPISPELDILTKPALQNNFISSEKSQLQDPNGINILDTPMPFYGESSTAPAPLDIFPLDCPISLDHPDVINFLDNLLNMAPSADVNNPFSNLISDNIEFSQNLIESSNLNVCHQMLESTALQPTVLVLLFFLSHVILGGPKKPPSISI